MTANAQYDDWFAVPGGDNFAESSDLFVAGARDMEPGEILLMDGYTLIDAMSAFEIGEPRLDSGMILDEQRRPPFDPLAPLLPEEVCWLLDRSFACEMEWHAGKALSQSVFTLLFVHTLPDINPEYLTPKEDEDPSRPQRLITIVLRAGILGLLKCCDLAWRELSKNKLHEIEDWQAEKCDVSLLEGINADLIIHMLDSACGWLRQSDLSEAHVANLCDRLLLRKSLLQLMKSDPLKEAHELWYNLPITRGLVHRVRTSPKKSLPLESPALLAMDPYIGRRLPNFMPIRITELPSPEQTWDSLNMFLEYWTDIAHLVNSPSLLQWEAAGSLRHVLNRTPPVAFQRSLVQTVFFDKELVMGTHQPTWLVQQFFYETIGWPYTTILHCFDQSAPHGQHSPMQDIIERRIPKLMIPHIRSNWYNPPRRRRHLMKEVLQWHMLYDVMLKEVGKCKSFDRTTAAILTAIPRTAQLGRLTACSEVILSGFQQELYAPEEKPIAYWYLSRVLEVHLDCIENLLPVVPSDTSAYHELTFQADHLAALQMISTTLVVLTAGYITSSWGNLSLNFRRRFKWVFNDAFDNLVPAGPLPDLLSLPPVLKEMRQDVFYSPSATLQLAEDIISRLSASSHDWISHWAGSRKQYLRNIADICGQLKHSVPSRMVEVANFDLRVLEWITDVHPWFPTVSQAS